MVGYPAGSGITVQHEIADIAKATRKLTFSGGFYVGGRTATPDERVLENIAA